MPVVGRRDPPMFIKISEGLSAQNPITRSGHSLWSLSLVGGAKNSPRSHGRGATFMTLAVLSVSMITRRDSHIASADKRNTAAVLSAKFLEAVLEERPEGD